MSKCTDVVVVREVSLHIKSSTEGEEKT